eukprot:200834-Hanusia_phi.AAC.2
MVGERKRGEEVRGEERKRGEGRRGGQGNYLAREQEWREIRSKENAGQNKEERERGGGGRGVSWDLVGGIPEEGAARDDVAVVGGILGSDLCVQDQDVEDVDEETSQLLDRKLQPRQPYRSFLPPSPPPRVTSPQRPAPSSLFPFHSFLPLPTSQTSLLTPPLPTVLSLPSHFLLLRSPVP